jgi:hypothetical protein
LNVVSPSSSTPDKKLTNTLTEPLIALRLASTNGVFHPGDQLECEYQIDAVQLAEIQAVEASVMWYTEGKGDEDIGVHYFERYTPGDAVDGDVRQLHRVRVDLPRSPLTYSGRIVKIRWCIRVRLFWGRGKETCAERTFQLVPRDTGDKP